MATSRDYYQKLIKTHRDRLAVLELKKAQYGIDVPPHIATEIEDIELKVRAIEAGITALDTVVDLANGSGDRTIDRRDRASYEERQHIMIATVMANVAELANVKKFVGDEVQKVHVRFGRYALIGVAAIAGNFLALVLIVVLFLLRGAG